MPFAVVGPRDKYIQWSKPEKDKYRDITYLWNLKHTHTHTIELIYKQKQIHRHRKQAYAYQRGKEGG